MEKVRMYYSGGHRMRDKGMPEYVLGNRCNLMFTYPEQRTEDNRATARFLRVYRARMKK